MGKFKPAKSKAKRKTPTTRGAVPCIVFLISVMALLILLFYSILKPS